jgi:hypothetical protein
MSHKVFMEVPGLLKGQTCNQTRKQARKEGAPHTMDWRAAQIGRNMPKMPPTCNA